MKFFSFEENNKESSMFWQRLLSVELLNKYLEKSFTIKCNLTNKEVMHENNVLKKKCDEKKKLFRAAKVCCPQNTLRSGKRCFSPVPEQDKGQKTFFSISLKFKITLRSASRVSFQTVTNHRFPAQTRSKSQMQPARSDNGLLLSRGIL